jgi:uncharacterized protein YggU (UPF0235/DUF167 family)
MGRMADGSLKVAVTAAPEAGRANRAVEELLAEWLGLGRARVRVVAGAASRLKQVEIEGLDAAELERRIARGVSAAPEGGGTHGE